MSFTSVVPDSGPTAKQLAFEKYYKYQPFCEDRLLTVLRDKKLYFSDPISFNDPWDCKPWFDYRPMLEDPIKRREMVEFFRLLVSPEMLAHPYRQLYDNAILTDDEQLKSEVEIYSRGLAEEIRKMRVYCLSTKPLSTLMWSHYAENHRGICLEFDKHNEVIEKARCIRYRDTYPEWTPQAMVGDPLALILSKAKEWCYEQEFRIIGSPTGGPIKLVDGQFVPLPEGALTAIILGCDSPHEAELTNLIDQYAPGLTIKRMVRIPNHYKLAISVVDRAAAASSLTVSISSKLDCNVFHSRAAPQSEIAAGERRSVRAQIHSTGCSEMASRKHEISEHRS